jgi:hypothetical protein
MPNDTRIEKATRDFVGAVLTGEQIQHLVKASSPEWNGGIYPSDVAYVRSADGFVPRGKSAYGDGVLEYLGTDSFKVLATDQIVRKSRSGRGRGTTAPKDAAVVAAELAAIKAKLTPASEPSAPPVQAKPKRDGSATA